MALTFRHQGKSITLAIQVGKDFKPRTEIMEVFAYREKYFLNVMEVIP
jgi:hypothetical protein